MHKLRILHDGKVECETEATYATFTHAPREATNSESPKWQEFIKGKKRVTINTNDLEPIRSDPKMLEGSIKYYYRRGQTAFFKFGGLKLKITCDDVSQLKGVKYGTYQGRIALV